MKKDWRLIEKITAGEKTIESRWYKAKYAPWNRVKPGDSVYFKDSGCPVSASAAVIKVLQFADLDEQKFNEIIRIYAKNICLKNVKYDNYYKTRKYCILIFLENPKQIEKPFFINKSGYGISSAWICTEDINKIRV